MLVTGLKQRTINKELLRRGINECKAFITPLPGKGKAKYFFGGGFYDEESLRIVLYMDYIRPNYTEFSANDAIYVMCDGNHCDILFKSGLWLSGVTADKIDDAKYDYPTRRFTDDRVLITHNNIKIVDMLSIQPSVAEQNQLYHIHTPPTKILSYPNPLTFAYIKDGDETRIGYWDMIKNKLVGETERMEVPLLDKSG